MASRGQRVSPSSPSRKRLPRRYSSTPELESYNKEAQDPPPNRRLSLEPTWEERHDRHINEDWTESVEHLHNGTRFRKERLRSDTIKINDRVVVHGIHSGVLRYLGTVQFSSGVWAGVELDQPVGNCSGKSQGRRYFSCSAHHGMFVKKNLIVKEPEVEGMAMPEHVEELEKEIDTLKTELKVRDEALATASQESRTVEAAFARELDALQTQNDRLMKTLTSERIERNQLEQRLGQSKEAHEKLKEQLSPGSDLTRQDSREGLRVQQLEEDLRRARTHMQEAQEDHERKLKAARAELDALRNAIETADQTAQQWKHAAKAAELRVQQLEIQAEHDRLELEPVRGNVSNREGAMERERLELERDQLVTKAQHLDEQLQQSQRMLVQEKQTAVDQQHLLDNELQRVREQLSKERDESRSVRDQLHEMQLAMRDLESAYTQATDKLKLAELQSQGQNNVHASELSLQMDNIARQLHEAQAANSVLARQQTELRTEQLETEADLRKAEAKIRECQRLLEVERQSHETTKSLLETSNQTSTKYIQLKKEHELLLIRTNGVEREVNRLRERLNNSESSSPTPVQPALPSRRRSSEAILILDEDEEHVPSWQEKAESLQMEFDTVVKELKDAGVTSVSALVTKCQRLEQQLAAVKAKAAQESSTILSDAERRHLNSKVEILQQQLASAQRRKSFQRQATTNVTADFFSKVAALRLDREYYFQLSDILNSQLKQIDVD
eukprot:TRINITY_DN8650_c0_g1_i4.p1 TRINITY_DN8650_c0_g1~~TRINITY_DN8650_c0_g1_i4.p1  ORF type:complete len:756 (+),score=210.88 TRINITY_DN8650_c0_g1_i4:80-2269(+)